MQQQPYDWREEPRRFSISSLLLLLVFVGAVGFVVYLGVQMKPWESDEPEGGSLAAETPAAAPTEVPAADAAPVAPVAP
jgi:hypothetical protein